MPARYFYQVPDRTVFDQLHAFVHGNDTSVKYNCCCHILVFMPKLVIFPVSRDDMTVFPGMVFNHRIKLVYSCFIRVDIF